LKDPSINWEPRKTKAEFPLKWLPIQIILTLVLWIISLIVDIIGYFVCIPLSISYVKTGTWPKWGWAWRDHRGGEPEEWWWTGKGSYGEGKHWSTKWRTLGVYWWNAVRNPSSNFGRYWPWDDCSLDEVRETEGSHHGSMNPRYTVLQGKKFAYVVRWDSNRPWLAWFEFTYRWDTPNCLARLYSWFGFSSYKYAEGKFGFKVGGVNYEGLGYTVRLHPYRTYTSGKENSNLK